MEKRIANRLSSQDCYQYIVENDLLEINSERLQRFQEKPIASGYFGQVYLGLLDGTTVVAIKTVKTSSKTNTPKQLKRNTEQREAMRDELKIFAEISGHENVVQLLGAITKNEKEFCIILEYCKHKGLDSFLTIRRALFIDEIVHHMTSTTPTVYKSEISDSWATKYSERRVLGHITTSDLLAFALQVSRGLEFLHDKKILHRDLALRNILVTEEFNVKIADFGLSRLTEDDRYYDRNKPKLPYKWLPIEAQSTGTTPLNSDLWTFGVLLWELFSLHAEPYSGMNPNEYWEFIRSGKRLIKPRHAPSEIYELMLALWNIDPKLRPSMAHCQSVINRELCKSCPPLAETHKQNYYYDCAIDKTKDLRPNMNSTTLQSMTTETQRLILCPKVEQPIAICRMPNRESVTIEMTPFISERDSTYNSALTIVDTIGLIPPATSTPARRKNTLNIDTVPLPKAPNKDNRKTSFCTLRRISVAVTILILSAIAAIAIKILLSGQAHNEKKGTVTESLKENISCPSKWIYFPATQACYRAFYVLVTWKKAEKICQENSGHLTSIHSDVENKFVADLASTPEYAPNAAYYQTFIGLQDFNGDRHWSWSDGSTVNYFNWAPNEPSDTDVNGVKEDCTHLGYWNGIQYQWNDFSCNDRYPESFVCKKSN